LKFKTLNFLGAFLIEVIQVMWRPLLGFVGWDWNWGFRSEVRGPDKADSFFGRAGYTLLNQIIKFIETKIKQTILQV
jgi:hypothetical protein